MNISIFQVNLSILIAFDQKYGLNNSLSLIQRGRFLEGRHFMEKIRYSLTISAQDRDAEDTEYGHVHT